MSLGLKYNQEQSTKNQERSVLRVAFLTVMPSPYVQDLFARLAADVRFDLQVFYMEQVAPDTYWGEQAMPEYAQVLEGRWLGVAGARVHRNPRALEHIVKWRPDVVVVVGYIGLTNQLVMRGLSKAGIPWVFWGEIPGLHQRGFVGRKIRGLLQRPLRHAAGIAGVGSHAVKAYQTLLHEQPGRRVFANIPYHCELASFREAAAGRVRGDGVRFLYCGQLIERKGVDLLLDAFTRLIDEGMNARLILVGDGPLKERLNQLGSSAVRQRIEYKGFLSVSELPKAFSEADVFVLPSRHDGWGVVVNQAIAAAMPVIATENVGSVHDLVIDGQNGHSIDAGSVDALYAAMKKMVAERSLIDAFGMHSQTLMSVVDVEMAPTHWFDFLERAIDRVAA